MDQARQFSLFGGRRQRGKQPPPPTEFRVHVAIADVIRRWCRPGWRWTHLPFGERRSAITGARLKRMGVNRGWPDFVFVGLQREVVWLELKRRGRKLSPEQLELADHLRRCGFTFLQADGFASAIEQLKQHGVLSATVHVQ